MARTIRRQPREAREGNTSYYPSKRARSGEKRSRRQATRQQLRKEYATC